MHYMNQTTYDTTLHAQFEQDVHLHSVNDTSLPDLHQHDRMICKNHSQRLKASNTHRTTVLQNRFQNRLQNPYSRFSTRQNIHGENNQTKATTED